MADTDVLIKDLPLTETVNDSDDLVTEDSSPTTHRIKASIVKDYINKEQNEKLEGIETDFSNVNANIGSLSSRVSDAVNTVSSMRTTVNNLDGRVQANTDNISELNSSLADKLDKNDSGSSFTATVNTAGYLTSSGTNVLFMIAITNKDETIDSITTNNTQIRQGGSYLTGSSSGVADFPSGGSTTFSQTALGTRVTMVFPSSIAGTNNDSVGVYASLTIKFK